MRDLIIRPATPADLPSFISRIRALSAHEGRDEVPSVSERDLEGAFFGEDAINEAFVIEHRELGEIGCAVFFTVFSTYHGKRGLHLEDLIIDDHARGRGIGEAVMAWLAAETIRRGFAALQWTVVEDNEGAIRFYERLGASRATGFLWYRLVGDELRGVAASAS